MVVGDIASLSEDEIAELVDKLNRHGAAVLVPTTATADGDDDRLQREMYRVVGGKLD